MRKNWLKIVTIIAGIVSLVGVYTTIVIEVDHIHFDHAVIRETLAHIQERLRLVEDELLQKRLTLVRPPNR